MTYKEILQTVDTLKALALLGIEAVAQGAYAKFACPSCKGKAAIKLYSDKKNLYYCVSCKASGHIINLVMNTKGIIWEEAVKFLEKALQTEAKKITEELNLTYELQYHKFIEALGISEDICKFLEIGVPKGKTMLAGSVAFTVRDEKGMRVAYYGIKIKDGTSMLHKSFNPELYLYNFCNIDKTKPVRLTTDIFRCVRYIAEGTQSVCNFNLPYLSKAQLKLLKDVEYLILSVDNTLLQPFATIMAASKMGYFKFE